MRATLSTISLLCSLAVAGAPVHLLVDAPAYPGQQVTLYLYMDAFTRLLEPVAKGYIDSTGHAALDAEVTGTRKALLRIGEAGADLWLRPGSYHVQLPKATGAVYMLSGPANVELTFLELDAMDVNALMSDLNGRLDAFVAEGLATDAHAGMEAVAKSRSGSATLQPDTIGAHRGLYLSPTWSPARADTFAAKLRNFYNGVNDPWFQQNLEYGLAGLYLGPHARARDLFERYLLDKPVLYEVPEYTRFFTGFFKDHLLTTPFRSQPEALLACIREGRTDSLKALLARSDFLHDGRINELVILTNLYANRGNALFDPGGILKILRDVEARSTFAEHRMIAANMVRDLTVMTPGTRLPQVELLSPTGRALPLDSLLQGDACVLVVQPGRAYSEQELAAITALHKEYGRYVQLLCIALDQRPPALAAWLRTNRQLPGTWAAPADQRSLLDAWRIRSAPKLFLLRDGVLRSAPGPLPSKGLGAELHKLKVEQEARQQLTPDRGPPRR